MTVRNEIHRLVEVAFERAQSAGELPPLELPDFAVERPARPEHGDFAVSLALRLARPACRPFGSPRRLAATWTGRSFWPGLRWPRPGL